MRAMDKHFDVEGQSCEGLWTALCEQIKDLHITIRGSVILLEICKARFSL